MKSPFILIAACSAFISCRQTTNETVTESAGIKTSDIYQPAVVTSFLQAHASEDRGATDLFLKAVDAYRNKKTPAVAIPLFTQSLQKHPSGKAYYELGNALLDTKNFRAALSSYKMAEGLGYEPLSKLLYNTACAYAGLYQKQSPVTVAVMNPLPGNEGTYKLRDSALKFLEFAIEAGYSDAAHISKDTDLAVLRAAGSDEFTGVYTTALGGQKDPETVLWQEFRRGFPQASLPLALNSHSLKNDGEQSFISYGYERFVPEMKGARFSREVSKEFYYFACVGETRAYTALVYAAKNVMIGENAPVGFVLTSYDGKGKIIDKLVAAGQLEPEDLLRVGTIGANGSIEVKEYKQQWAKDPEKAGYYENKVVSTALKGIRHYHITGDGHFEEDLQSLGLR